ncbi:tautomerase PptA [Pantoea osteomyelitidis]|uniref:Tautomerase PptA n=1 Tax=Pantoea osteomyelitidis TaxID=3230026 RepID=A0ABW7Q1L4_9GAMM
MPHLDLHFNPRDLSENDIAAMADDLRNVLKRHLGTNDDAISMAFTQVSQENWKAQVYDPIISPVLDQLYKTPGYKL